MEVEDATRRTRLANERTYLAWWRTGLSSFAVAIGAGKIVPELTDGPTWPYTVIGIGLALLGIVCCAYAYERHTAVNSTLDDGQFAELDRRMTGGLSIVAALLGGLLVVALLVG